MPAMIKPKVTDMLDRLRQALAFLAIALLLGCATNPAPDQPINGRSYDVRMDGKFDGYERTYRVHVPTGYREGEPTALVVVLHGAFSGSAEIEKRTGFSALADREGFAVVYPEGIGILGFLQHWNAGHCCGKAAADGVDDVGFVADVIEEVKSYLTIDAARIYMTGFSNGAMLTHRFAAERPEMLAAAAPLAGAISSRGDADEPDWQIPTPRSGVPMIMFHGREDLRIPYADTGRGNGVGGRYYSTALASSRFWSSSNGCESHRREQNPSFAGVTVDTWSDCEKNADVLLFTLGEWGHRWPGPYFTQETGPQSPLYQFDATEIIWAFFEKYRRPQDSARSAFPIEYDAFEG
jgi:polyhydroxybutyrate depolymerase